MSFHDKSVKGVFAELKSSRDGLSSLEAKRRISESGLNEIKHIKPKSALKLFLEQFVSPIVWILIFAMIISLVLKHYTDFWVIAFIVVANACFGFYQEFRAEKAIEALKKMIALRAKVLRNGKPTSIPASELVPGDLILLEAGDKVPADARLIDLTDLQTLEASLTGESLPIKKHINELSSNLTIGDMKNMVFSSTIVSGGRGKAIVTATAMNTEVGKIAHMIQQEKPEPTPLQKNLEHLGRFLTVAVVIIAIVIFFSGIATGKGRIEMLFAAIALAVAAIPEGLPAVVTVALSLGVQKLARRNALMRKLPSVETLGACSVICTDKTGTLTHNEMTVKKIFVNEHVIAVPGHGYEFDAGFGRETKSFGLLLQMGVLNNNSSLEKKGDKWSVVGDPTEGALIVSAKKAKIDTVELLKKYPRIEEIPFSSERKRMTTIHKHGAKKLAFMKGAPDVILKYCNRVWVKGQVKRLTKKEKDLILKENKDFASDALRVLGFAYKELSGKEDPEKEMIFVGLQGMIDPPRREAKLAIQKAKSAGIHVVMITGDFEGTANAIARELNITGKSISGSKLDKLSDLELDKVVEEYSIYARVNPEHKLKIVNALKRNGHIVAMTGDGVNDAPALKRADLGIAMGITGTDVAKEASDMILADDNFATIVSAIEVGRTVFDNIKKFVEYLLSSNMGEVLTVFVALLIGLPLPVTALMLLWINLVTDGLPALALGVEPAEPNIMERSPRDAKEKIMNKRRGTMMFLIGAIMMLGTLFIFDWYDPELNLAYAQTMAFTTLVMFQMFNVLNQRSEDISFFRLGIFTNKLLLGAIALSIFLQLFVIYVPFMNTVFGTVPITALDWLWVTLIASSVLIFGEVVKLFSHVRGD